jgi:hypothetical protein
MMLEKARRSATESAKQASATAKRMAMDVRREEVAGLMADATGLTVAGGLLSAAGCGWMMALTVFGGLLVAAGCGWLVAFALVLWKWYRYGRAKLQAATAGLAE